jgi:hypothetical protein
MRKMLRFLIPFCFITGITIGQTTLINPAGDGGFENGATPALNNWTDINSSTDAWHVGSVPVASAGVNCGYISSDGGTSWTYSQFSVIQHIYYDVTIPTGESKLTLTFKWKVGGEGTTSSDWDNMKVFFGLTSDIGLPVANTAISATYQKSGPGAVSGMYKLNSASWNSETIFLSGVPGSTYRLVFSWKSDGSTIINPPAAIDEVSLISSAPVPLIGGNTYPINGTSNPPVEFATITEAATYIMGEGVSGTGQVIFELGSIYDSSTEPGPISIGIIPGVGYTLGVTFRPATGVTVLTAIAGGASPNQHAISLAGCSFVTLDGRAGGVGSSRDWTIRVTGTTNAQMAVRLNNSGPMSDIHIRNLIMEGSATSTTGGIFQLGVSSTATNTISNVIIENNLIRSDAAYRGYGVTIASASSTSNTSVVFRNNDITRFAVRGINLTGGFPGIEVYGNQIRHTEATTQPSTSEFSGIYFSTSASPGAKIYNNFIYDIQLTNVSTATNGIYMFNANTTGDAVEVFNNVVIVGDKLTGTAATNQVYAIRDNSTSNGLINFYFNTAAVSGAAPSGTAGTAAFRKQTSNFLNIHNNIFFNARTNDGGTGTGTHWAIMLNNTTLTSIGNNDYWASGVGGVLGTTTGAVGGNQLTLAAWKVALPADATSVSQDPYFVDLSANPPDLRIDATNQTQLESGAITIAGIVDDYDGTPRYPNVGYPEKLGFPPSAPDIGAFEFGGEPLDISPPVISYTPFQNTSILTGRTLSASITDPSGVPTSGTGLPVLYWRISNDPPDPYIAATGLHISGTDYEFTFGSGVVLGDTVQYYIVAQDEVTPPNVGAFPAGGADGFTANPPAVSTPPTSPNSYSIVSAIAGTVTVGPGGDYETLTGTGGLFAGINASVVSGNIVAEVISNLTEDGTNALNEWSEEGIGNYTLTIQPDAALNRIISGAYTGGLIRLNGADRVTIDGSFGRSEERYLTIENTSILANTAAIQVISLGTGMGSNDVTISNCNISAGTNTVTSTFGIYAAGATISTSGTGANNNNLTIENNNIYKAYYGIYARGVATSGELSGLVVSNNMIGSDVEIAYITGYGIYSAGISGAIISGNKIYNIIYDGGKYGMYFGANVSNCDISENSIHTFNQTNTTAYYTIGIYFSSSTSVSDNSLFNNAIYDLNMYGSTSNFYYAGIRIVGGTNFKLYYNSISITGAFGSATAGCFSQCLFVSTASTNMDLVNNVFYNTRTGTSPKSYTVHAVTGTTFTVINYNDYYSSGAAIGFLGSEVADFAAWQTATGQDVNSFSSDPLFNSNTNLQPQNGSPLLGAGTPITGITTDINGTARSLTAPTVGAYETESDSAPPSIVYTPLESTTSTSARTLVATVTDASGVPSSAPGWPHLYWKKTGDVGFTGVAPTAVNGDEFTFEFGGGVVGLDIVEYYIVAQDEASPINIGSFPSAGAGGFTANPPAASTPPSNPSSYSIVSSLSGTYTIGTGGDFEALTGNGGLFQVINFNALSGNVIAEVITDLSETGLHGLNEWLEFGDGNYTLTIKPGEAVSKNISGDYAGGLIRLNGADRVIIDGSFNMSAENYLTFQNLSSATNTAAIQIISLGTDAGAVDNTIQNCAIAAGSNVTTSTFAIFVGGANISTSGTGAHNNNLTIENNIITKAYYGIYVSGVATTGVITGLSITNNTIGADLADDYIGFRGVNLAHASGTIAHNKIYNVTISTAVIPRGIEVGTGVVDTEILSNEIYNIQNLTTTSFRSGQGISLSTGSASSNITVANNSLHGFRGHGSGTATNNMWGIIILGGGGYNIYYNSINMYNNGTLTGSTDLNGCIYIASAASNLNVVNNVFSATGDVGNSTTLGFMYGIYSLAANTAYLSINYNNYFVSGTRSMLGYIGATNRPTLADWQTATGQDANSLNADPLLATNTNLQPLPGSPVLGAGTAIAGIDVDILDVDRDDTTPSIGAYENAAPVGALAGTVTEATRSVIEGAVITIGNKSGVTDEFGAYLIENILIGSYTVTCEAEGYLTETVNDVVILENQTTNQNFILDFGQISLTPSLLEFYLMPEGSDDAVVNISNPAGTGPLTWSASTVVWNVDTRGTASNSQTGEYNNEESEINPEQSPFDFVPARNFLNVQGSFSVGSPGFAQYGIATDGEFIYTCAWNSTSFGKYTMSGAYIGSFTITGVSSIRDLTYDGQYFYGSPTTNAIYKMDFTNQLLVETINITPSGNLVRGIAYDATNDAFWVTSASFAGPLKLIDRTGATLQTLTTTAANFTGLAWDNVTAGGPYLWAYTQSEPAGNTLVQIDITTGNTIQSIDIVATGAISGANLAGGLVITDLLTPGLTALIGLSQNEAVWILEISSWLSIDISSGVIAPAGNIDVTVSVDATDLDEGIYNGKVLIAHDGQEVNRGISEVPVTMYVFGACPQPYNLNASNITATSAFLTWTQFSGAEKWNVEIGLPGFVPGTGNATDEYTGVEETNLLALGLDPETTYNFFVQASCEEDVSSWSAPYQFTTLELCPTPTAPLANGITATSANLGWMENGSATTWAIEYGIDPYTFTGTPSLTVNTNPYNLTGLTADTPYQFKVRAVCGGDVSNWSSTGSFTTLCASVPMPFTEDFTGLLATEIPDCWSKADLGPTNWGAVLTGNAGGTSPEMRLYWSPSFTGISRLITPPIATGGNLDLMIRLNQYLDDYIDFTGESIAIEYSVDGGTNWVEFWEHICNANYGPVYDLIPFTLPPASVEFLIAFKFEGYIFNINNWYFDDILIDELKYPVTFNVDMSTAAGFDPGTEVVYIAGDFPGATWNQPGSNPDLLMSRVGTTDVYTLTLDLPPANYQYKYFRNAGWDGGEWAGGANRNIAVTGIVETEDVFGGEITFANLQWPPDGTITEGGSFITYGQAFIPNGITASPGATFGLEAWVGINSADTDPAGWSTWVPATFNSQAGDNDEFLADIAPGLTPGTYYYAYRYRFGEVYGEYLYGGYNGGFWNGTTNVSGILTVNAGGPPSYQLVGGAVNDCIDATDEVEIVGATVENGAIADIRSGGIITATDFEVKDGGTAYLTAATSITLGIEVLITPGTTGMFLAKIDTFDPCVLAQALVATVEQIIPALPAATTLFKVFPNPTTGSFKLELTGVEETSAISVEIFGMMGERVFQDQLFGSMMYEFDLSNMPKGIYFIRVLKGDEMGIEKVIKQ